VALLVTSPMLIAASPALPVKTVSELIALAKASPGKLSYASAGAGSSLHMTGELFLRTAGINMLHVPYKGGGPAMASTIGGETEVTFQTPLAAVGHIQSGRLRALAVTSGKRLAMLPEVATTAEAGMPRFDFQTWVGLLAPASTPAPIVKLLNEHVVKAARSPEVAERFARDAVEVAPLPRADFTRFVADEMAVWTEVIRDRGITPG
jgi:tripartite-type tricarboxylate transporter receptor subunit TctC